MAARRIVAFLFSDCSLNTEGGTSMKAVYSRLRILTSVVLAGVLSISSVVPEAFGFESNASAGPALRARPIVVKPDHAVIAPGYDHHKIEVKFLDGADIGLSIDGMPYDRSGETLKSADATGILALISAAGGTWRRMSANDEYQVDRLIAKAAANLGREIADLNNYFILRVPEGVSAEDWIDKLNSLSEVEIALARPLPAPPPTVPGSFQSSQGYLNSATDGVDAIYGWSQPGGSSWPTFGGPVWICDFEYSWNLNHNDLPLVTTWLPPGYTAIDPYTDDNHGTGVLGVMQSLDNGWGTKGISFATHSDVAPTFLKSFSDTGYTWQLGTAMMNMLSVLGPGDIFLIEQQMAGPNYTGVGQDGYVPVEWWQAWYNIIVAAVGNGIHVVEAAGNGQEDLDDPVYSTGNGGHWPFLSSNNSGAIIVGAGAAPAPFGGSDTDRSRLWFSNWGSRIDLQGWGEKVVTTGYGDYYSAEGKDYWYTALFNGTSSASPTVAGAVALIASIYRQQSGGGDLSPAAVRSALTATGSPQQAGTYPVSQHIGPRPDIQAALAALAYVCGDADASGSVDIDDVVYLIAYIFSGGPAPSPLASGDADCSGGMDIDDVVYIIAYIFSGGNSPCDPDGNGTPNC